MSASLKYLKKLRFISGADAINTAEQAVTTLQQQANAYREVSTSRHMIMGSWPSS